PLNPSPANNAQSPSTSPNICATVSDPNGGNLTVRFYGRKKTIPGAKFTIIGLPDTQFYTEELPGTNSGGGGHNGIFKAQTQWIADHRIDSNVAFVVQLGDCVQNGDNPPGADNTIEWRRADTAMKKIENPAVPIVDGIPYGICVGNHDQGTGGNPDLPSVYYNQYFGETRFAGRAYYGGHYGVTNNDNHYQLFSAGGINFIHISIEYYPDGTTASLQPVLDWADALLKTHSNRKGILSTHNMLGTGSSASFQGPGQKIYDDLKDNPNLILMLAGHVPGEGRRTDVFNGNTIHTIMADYQSGYSNGGNGYLRIMQFLPDQNLMSVKTYSPYSNTSFTGSSSQFTLPVNLSDPFTLIGTNSNVASGSVSCMNWPSLAQFTDYEWYVEVSDGENTTTGPVWTFT
ncbi:MAG: metallophosphoesterase, partial [Chitinophagaceae bacterium]